jgi:hypothetical protein
MAKVSVRISDDSVADGRYHLIDLLAREHALPAPVALLHLLHHQIEVALLLQRLGEGGEGDKGECTALRSARSPHRACERREHAYHSLAFAFTTLALLAGLQRLLRAAFALRRVITRRRPPSPLLRHAFNYSFI